VAARQGRIEVTPDETLYVIHIGEGIRPAVKWDKAEATDYAARYHGIVVPYVPAKRKDELLQERDMD
jgi:hypothetical protein